VLALSAVYAETALLRLQRIYCTNVTQQVHEFTTNPQQIDGVWALPVGLQENRGLKICKITAASRKNLKNDGKITSFDNIRNSGMPRPLYS